MSQLIITDLESTTLIDLEERAALNGRTLPEEAKAILKAALVKKSLEPRDDWERELLESARPWGVSFSDEAIHDMVRGTEVSHVETDYQRCRILNAECP